MARAQAGESLRATTLRHHPVGQALILGTLSLLAWQEGDLAAARAQAEASLSTLALHHHVASQVWVLETLALTAWQEGDLAEAEALCVRGLDLSHTLRDADGYALPASQQATWGLIARARGDLASAHGRFRECLRLAHVLNLWAPLLAGLDGLAGLAAAKGHPEEAVRLFATTAATRGAQGAVRSPALEALYAADLAAARANLTPQARDAAQAAGAALSLLQAATDVLDPECQEAVEGSDLTGLEPCAKR